MPNIKFSIAIGVLAVASWMVGTNCSAQNINVSGPVTTNSGSFFENNGVNFGFSLPGGRGNGSRVVGFGRGGVTPNLVFQNGGGGVVPPFGGFNPASGASFGFGRAGSNGGGFSLGLNLAQGSSRQSTTTTPSLTTQNGGGGTLFSGQVRPFATGIIPIVGQGGDFRPRQNFVELPTQDNGVTRALQSGQLNSVQRPREERFQPSAPLNYSDSQSTATTGDLSVNAIKAERERRIAAQNQIISGMIESARQLEQEKEFALARAKYREARTQAKDDKTKAIINRMIKATRSKD